MKNYDHSKIEKKWQKIWDKTKANVAKTGKGKKFYPLVEFPYPSGDGLHTGHVRGYTAMDVISRKRRAEGYNVMYPIGWDAFGLPTENYAIKTGISPEKVTKKNTDTFRKQLKELGLSFDWSREINTTDPEYYKWTQWIFLQFFKKGLAYKKRMEINWCPSCKIGLANEEVIDGKCERCGGETTKKEKEQWMLAITKYADRLYKDLDKTDYLEKIKVQQRNWIGRSEGSEINFNLEKVGGDNFGKISVFTTRADTLFGVTYVVLAPEHPLVHELKPHISNVEEVEAYIITTQQKNDQDRTDDTKEKTGAKLDSIFAVNPANGERVPVWIADYVLPNYGTGAVMAVPAHDQRDFEFANKYNLPVKEVVALGAGKNEFGQERGKAFTEDGILVNSGKFSGLKSEKARKEITKFVGGKNKTTFKLRDWVFSRQRYWGEPIPLVHCDKCGWTPVPEKELPLKLPKVKNYTPTDTGESPLAEITKWVNTKCPKCKKLAKRETDTMPNWAGSSWYYLAYTMQGISNFKFPITKYKKAFKYWTPVDWYNGGMEHTTLHLLYSRFWHKFLYDLKIVPKDEPYTKRTSHGLILAEGGVKMSKSKGNVVNPDGVVKLVGADALRVYEMFMGPFDQAIAWSVDGVAGAKRFIERVWKIQEKIVDKKTKVQTLEETEVLLNQTIKKVSEDIEEMKFNTAISSLMILSNQFEKESVVAKEDYKTLVKLLSPFAPHICEEIWQKIGEKKSVHVHPWPKWNNKKLTADKITIAVTVNGKVRGTISLSKDADEKEALKLAMSLESVNAFLSGKEPQKVIYVKGKILNLVA